MNKVIVVVVVVSLNKDTNVNENDTNNTDLSPIQTDPTLLAYNTQHYWAQKCCASLCPSAWNHNNVGTSWHLLSIV